MIQDERNKKCLLLEVDENLLFCCYFPVLQLHYPFSPLNRRALRLLS